MFPESRLFDAGRPGAGGKTERPSRASGGSPAAHNPRSRSPTAEQDARPRARFAKERPGDRPGPRNETNKGRRSTRGGRRGSGRLGFPPTKGKMPGNAGHLWTLTHTPGGGVWHKASVSDCLPLAAPICLSPLLILTLCGPERVLVVSTEPPDDLSCLTTPGVGCPGDGLLPAPLTRCTPRVHAGVCQLQHCLVRVGVCVCRGVPGGGLLKQ